MSRRGTYRGIYSSLPDDPEFQALSPHARLVFYSLRCCAQAGPACIFRYYLDVVSAQSGLSGKETRRALSELQAAGWIAIEEPVLWIRNGLRYDPSVSLADPKHRKAIVRALEALPHLEIVLTFCDYYDFVRPFTRPLVRPLVRGGLEPGRLKSPEEEYRVPSTETETETEPPVVPHPGDTAASQLTIPPPLLERVPALATWPTVAALVALWNDHATRYGYPRVESVSPARRAKATAALRAFPDVRFWNGAFAHVRDSRFLSGQTAPANGHAAPFRADFDWLLSRNKDGTENVVKVHEGRYDDKERRP